MYKNMTIKAKLIASFVVVSILVAILAIYSITATGKSADGFTNYREMAKDSVLGSSSSNRNVNSENECCKLFTN